MSHLRHYMHLSMCRRGVVNKNTDSLIDVHPGSHRIFIDNYILYHQAREYGTPSSAYSRPGLGLGLGGAGATGGSRPKEWIPRQWPFLRRSPRPFAPEQPAKIWHISHLRDLRNWSRSDWDCQVTALDLTGTVLVDCQGS
eukprot:1194609-Prorocentrum_minimum.AAC.3